MIVPTVFTLLIVPTLLATSVVSMTDTVWLATNYPNPSINPTPCKVTYGSAWLCDPDAVLNSQEVSDVLATVQDINNGAECVCNCTVNPDSGPGYVVGVAVVGAIRTETTTQVDRSTMEAFSETVKSAWFSSSECDDKAILLLSRNASQMYINLGSRLSEIVPANNLESIYSETLPLLQETTPRYKEALETALRNFALITSENLIIYNTATSTPPMSTEAPEPEDNLVWGILGVIAILTILIFHYWIKY